jgi:hypothetical protein
MATSSLEQPSMTMNIGVNQLEHPPMMANQLEHPSATARVPGHPTMNTNAVAVFAASTTMQREQLPPWDADRTTPLLSERSVDTNRSDRSDSSNDSDSSDISKNSATSTDVLFRAVHVLSDHELHSQLRGLVQRKCVLDSELLLHLAELDRRRLYREQACPSMFTFCVSHLGMSEDVAYKRVTACRLLRRFPLAYGLLRNGRIHLTEFVLIGPHLTEDNQHEWFSLAAGKSKRELEKLIATRHPEPPVATTIRKLPEPRQREQRLEPVAPRETTLIATNTTTSGTSLDVAGTAPSGTSLDVAGTVPSGTAPNITKSGTALDVAPGATEPEAAFTMFDTQLPMMLTAPPISAASKKSAATSRISPLSGTTYRVTFTATESLKMKMDLARDLASHAVPPNDLPALIERALDLLIESEERRRCGKSAREHQSAKHNTAEQHTQTWPSSRRDSGKRLAQQHGRPGTFDKLTESTTTSQATEPGQASLAAEPEPATGTTEPALKTGAAEPIPAERKTSVTLPDPDPAHGSWGADHHAEHTKSEAGTPTETYTYPSITAVPEPPANLANSANPTNPTNPVPPTNLELSRYVPQLDRREVWTRDGGQCTFIDERGQRCPAQAFLELDHIRAHARFGSSTADNLRLRCKCHNGLEAERTFGQKKIETSIAKARERRDKQKPRE